jgi:hypothetical protein
MVRSISDNPGGISRSLPLSTNSIGFLYSSPFVVSHSELVPWGTSINHTFVMADADKLYYVSMISFAFDAYILMRAYITLNDDILYDNQVVGWCNVPFQSIYGIPITSDDELYVLVENKSGADQTIAIIVNGFTVPKPSGYPG